jgi:hypothetical protein
VARAEPWERGGTKRLRTAENTLTNLLQASRGPEALHDPLSSARRQVRIPRPIVETFVRAMFDHRHHLTSRGCVGAELVGNHPPRPAALLLQQAPQQALGRLGVTPALDDLIEDISVLIDGPPEPVLLAGDRDHDLVEVPDVRAARCLALEAVGVTRADLSEPTAGRSRRRRQYHAPRAFPRPAEGAGENENTTRPHGR